MAISKERNALIALPLSFVLLLGGCQESVSVSPVASTAAHAQVQSPQQPPAAIPPVERQPPVQLAEVNLEKLAPNDAAAQLQPPQIHLSAHHAGTCLVKIDARFPELTLLTIDGRAIALADQLPKQLALIVFWEQQQPMSVEQLRLLKTDVVDRFGAAGLAVVTIHVGGSADDADAVARRLEQFGLKDITTNLLDPDGKAFAMVASDLLPRSYLLRPDRTVLWMDLEYSRSTRRELANAVLFGLKQVRP
jgi:hypothetical protein